MNIQMITKILTDAGIEPNEAKIEVKMLLEHFANYTEKDRLMGKEPEEKLLGIVVEKAKLRAASRMPIQYIIGEAYFMGEYFKVSQDVLIPRDETEILVQRAIEIINNISADNCETTNLAFLSAPLAGEVVRSAEGGSIPENKKNTSINALDIGTGSGCIACSIAKNTNAYVLGVDISSDALRIALDNVTKLGINNRAVFRKSNLFEKIREEEKFDLIISNPPYIPESFVFEPEVLHEPKLALIAGENGLEFYRKITEQAPDYLTQKGWLMFELGIGEASAVKSFMEKSFENITIEKDLAGIERIIYGQKK